MTIIEFDCPHCAKVLKTAADKAGVRAKCPGCGELITVPGPDRPVEAPAFDRSSETDSPPGDSSPAPAVPSAPVSAPDTKPCPMCGAHIKAAAVRCRFCGEDLGPALPRQLDAGDIIRRSWAIYKQNFGLMVGETFAFVMLNVLAVAIAYGGFLAIVFSVGMAAQNNPLPVILAVVPLGIILFLGIATAANYLSIGHHIFLHKIARGEDAQIADLFAGKPFFWPTLFAGILFQMMVNAGMNFCFVPGIFLALMFWPFRYEIIHYNVGTIDSLSRANMITKNNFQPVILLALAWLGFQMLGLLACYVGLLFSTPFSTLLFAVAYTDLDRLRSR